MITRTLNATTDRRQMRIQNKVHHTIDLFRQHGELSKIQAKQLSGYAMSTVLAVFEQLQEQGIIVPSRVDEARNARGPKQTFFTLNSTRRLYLGVTFTQSGIYSAIVSFSGQVLKSYAETLDINGDKRRFLARLRAHLAMIRKENAALLPALAWAGLSMPGEIDKENGVLLSYTFMPYLKQVNFKAILAGYFPDIELQFDQNITGFLSCLLMDHATIRANPLILFISLRSGAASGIIYDGRIITPIGELGHTTVSDDPRQCACGRSGCLDLYLSHKGLSDGLIEALQARGRRPAQSYLTTAEIIELYRTDPALAAIVDRRFTYLARALLNAANLLAPDLIVISGELFECFSDPATTLARIAREAAGEGNLGRFARAKLAYRAMGTESSAIGLCYNRINKEFAYRDEEEP